MFLQSIVKRKWIFITPMILFITIFMIFTIILLSNRTTFYKGVTIANINVAGLSKEEALLRIQNKVSNSTQNMLHLVVGEKLVDIPFKDIEVNFMIGDAIETGFSIGRHGNPVKRVFTICGLWFKKVDIPYKVNYNKESLKLLLLSIKKRTDTEPKNASVLYKSDQPEFTHEIMGKFLDVDKNMILIENMIDKQNYQIPILIDETQPPIRYNDIKEARSLQSSFSTVFNPQDTNRTHNINLACKRINGTIVFPQKEYSMNAVLGKRTRENGYLEAPVIFHNELIPGTGGGVCQVTSTIYDAALLAKLMVTERTHHSMILGYVEPGQDATLVENSVDLKFINNQAYPISIQAEVQGNRVIVKIWGQDQGNKNDIKLSSVIIGILYDDLEELVYDESLEEGQRIVAQKAKKGVHVIVYRDTFDPKGTLLQREKISEDIYKPIRAKVKTGDIEYKKTE